MVGEIYDNSGGHIVIVFILDIKDNDNWMNMT